MQDFLILIGLGAVALLLVAIVIKVLRLSWMIFKVLFFVVLFAGIMFALLYSTGMLEAFPFLNQLVIKFKELIKPIHDYILKVAGDGLRVARLTLMRYYI